MLPILIASLVIDLILGEPPTWLHPVVYVGKTSEKLIRPYGGYWYGIFIWFASVSPVFLICISVIYIPVPLIKMVLVILILKTTFSIKLLYDLVKGALPLNDSSRRVVQNIVRRDLSSVSIGHVGSAAIESLFESLVDGITSPMFWFLLLGLPGALLQRFANTMDSMVGYKNPELLKEGYFSAKLDTILNFIPARITGIFMILAGFLLGMEVRNSLTSLRKANIESPNARYPIAIAAGILGVNLEKIGSYSVGDGNLPTDKDVERALLLFRVTLFLYLLAMLVCYYYLYGLAFLSYPYGLMELF
ncbi:cobalamin biosynthesis protein [Metallosphaera hakonensis]|uniref:Probable cobalamin biosynthesis protein CobD n=1 Tax=Metallosphaera hakonensis JCM 8857 = DSM 7519 TaxID=1293036 RepID=A0A2U9ITE4_9CREN|nr:cobalamin biosynthesis protein [Metallosphaera hakonensis]AWR99304.1 cobalamin biosynthesis protein [Metallosphaera hakonensis JCM 8857 = DSM 7519]